MGVGHLRGRGWDFWEYRIWTSGLRSSPGSLPEVGGHALEEGGLRLQSDSEVGAARPLGWRQRPPEWEGESLKLR